MPGEPLPIISTRYQAERALGTQPSGRYVAAIDTERGGRVTVFFPQVRNDAARLVRALEVLVTSRTPLRQTPYCTLRDAGLSPTGEAFVVLDRPLGVPLASLLRVEDRLNIDRGLSVAIQLCDLVLRAHTLNIWPVPLSPDNVIVDLKPTGRMYVSIVDLALDSPAYGESLERPALAPHYRAPQLRKAEPPDRRDDVFAVAALLHAMVFGVAPSPMGAYGPTDGTGWPLLPEGGRRLDRRLEACFHTVLLKGLAPGRADRFGQIEELQRALTGLRQLMSLSAPSFELLAATRGRLGRRGDPLDLAAPRPGMERAQEAHRRIREVVANSSDGASAQLAPGHAPHSTAGTVHPVRPRSRFRVVPRSP